MSLRLRYWRDYGGAISAIYFRATVAPREDVLRGVNVLITKLCKNKPPRSTPRNTTNLHPREPPRAYSERNNPVLNLRTTTSHKHINVQRFREGIVFKAHGLLHLSTLGLRVTKKKTTTLDCFGWKAQGVGLRV